MGIFDKLKFWKKHEKEFSEPTAPPGESGKDLGMPELGPMPKAPEDPRFAEQDVAPPPHMRDYQPTQPPEQMQQSPQLEIINSKLDAIKAILSALEQRLANLERSSKYEKKW